MAVLYEGFSPSKIDELFFTQKLSHYEELLPFCSTNHCVMRQNKPDEFECSYKLKCVHSEFNFDFSVKGKSLREVMDAILLKLHYEIEDWHDKRRLQG